MQKTAHLSDQSFDVDDRGRRCVDRAAMLVRFALEQVAETPYGSMKANHPDPIASREARRDATGDGVDEEESVQLFANASRAVGRGDGRHEALGLVRGRSRRTLEAHGVAPSVCT